MPGPWEDFAPTATAEPAAAGPWSDFKTPVTPPRPRTGSGLIPTEAEAAGKPYTPPAAPLQPPAPPTMGQKITGVVEAGLNLVTKLTGGVAGALAGIPASAGSFVNEAQRSAEAGTGISGMRRENMRNPVEAGEDVAGGVTKTLKRIISEPMDLAQEQTPDSPMGEHYTDKYVDPLLEGMSPLIGHAGGAGHHLPNAGRAVADVAERVRTRSGLDGARAARAADAKLEAPKLKGIREANEAGYVLPPTETRQGGATGAAAGAAESLSGEPKLFKAASKKNVETTNKLVREDVGLPEDEPITRQSLAKIRSEEGKKYEVLKKVDEITNDEQYFADLDKITQGHDTASDSFPHRSENPFQKTIDGLRQERMKGASAVEEVKLLRADADKAYTSGDKALGKSFRQAAEALDNSIDRHLTKMAESGDASLADAVADYRKARVRIAKTYQADAALNDTTGNIDASVYARALKKGRPLSGPGLTVARAAQQFPRALQKAEKIGNTAGPTLFDAGLSMLGGKLDIATLGGRPAARALLLSKPAQKLLTKRARDAKPETPPKAEPKPPEDPTTSPGAGPGTRPPPARMEGPLGDLTPDWETSPGAGGGKTRGGHEPGLVPAVGEKGITRFVPDRKSETPSKRAGSEIPAVEGRPDLPDTLKVGRPAESAATERANAALDEPGAQEAMRRAEQARGDAERAKIPVGETRELTPEQVAALETPKRGEIPVGEVTEGQPKIKTFVPKSIPVGKATEGQPPVKALVPKRIPKGEATEIVPEKIELGDKPSDVTIREVPGGFEAYQGGKKVGYLKDNLERGQAAKLNESANVDMVKVDKEAQGKGIGRALYEAFHDKHEGRILPSGKTEPSAWKVWKRNYPEKVDDFVKSEAARIRDGAEEKLVIGNITDPEVAQRVQAEVKNGSKQSGTGDLQQETRRQDGKENAGSDEGSKEDRGQGAPAEVQQRANEVTERDATQVAALKDTDGFTDAMEPVRRGNAESVLNAEISFNGQLKSRKQAVRDLIAGGAKIGTKEGQRALINPSGNYLLERQLTRTALDYAEHLLKKPPRKFVP